MDRDVDRDAIIARNEARFRSANEKIEAVGVELTADVVPFLCECGNATCTRPVLLTLAEYEQVRENRARFFVLRGHEHLEAEVVVDEHDRYAVVEKTHDARKLVEAAGGALERE